MPISVHIRYKVRYMIWPPPPKKKNPLLWWLPKLTSLHKWDSWSEEHDTERPILYLCDTLCVPMCDLAWHDIVAKPMSVYTIIWNDFVVRPHQCVWCCGPTLTPAPLTPDHTSPLPSLASLVTNECLYKAAASSTICRLPLNYVVELHYCTFALSLHGSAATSKPPPTQCVRQSLPLKRGFLGWDTSQVWNQTPLRCPFQERGWFKNYFLWANLPTWHQGAKAFVVQTTAATCSYLQFSAAVPTLWCIKHCTAA